MAGYKEYIRDIVQWLLAPMEKSIHSKRRELRYRPIFMVGPPRSGSTLLYQLMTRRYRCCYFSNLMMKFPDITASTARIARLFNGCNPPERFDSWYGETAGWRAPNQGISFWNRWLPPVTHELEVDVLIPQTSHHIRSTVAALQEFFDAPFVNKWQPNSMRLALLADIFPEALFIRIVRQRSSVISSILHARSEICRSGSGWFSIKPRGYEKMLSMPQHQQVEWQLDRIDEAIETSMNRIGTDRFFTVSLEDLRKYPSRVLDNIDEFYAFYNNSKGLEVRHSIPKTFPVRRAATPGEERL